MNILRNREEFPELSTKRLLLRQANVADAQPYHDILSQEVVSTYSDLPRNPTIKRTERFINWMLKLHVRQTGCAWIICFPENSQAIGAVRINSIDKKTQAGLLGYELHPSYWGIGIATEALAALVRHAHGVMQLNRLEAWTTPGNSASDSVLQKNGFKLEGVHRQKLMLHGQHTDLRLFARLAADKAIATD